MFRSIIYLVLLFIVGCATTTKPILSDSSTELKNGKSAVVFFDGSERIDYIADKYFVLGVSQTTSSSEYKGIWDSGKTLSAVHTEELTKIGVNAESIYDVYPDDILRRFRQAQKEIHFIQTSKSLSKEQKTRKLEIKRNPAAVLNTDIREALMENGFDSLFLISWSGFTLYMQTLGLPTIGNYSTNFKIFDLKNDSIIWDGNIFTYERVDIGNEAGKDFLEKNNLANFKSTVDNLIRERYKSRTGRGIYNKSIGQLIGLENPSLKRSRNQ